MTRLFPLLRAVALSLALFLPSFGFAGEAGGLRERVPRERYRQLLESVRESVARTATFTCRFHVQEYADGTMDPETYMDLKWRRSPRGIYLHFPTHKGREVIWREDWKKLRIHTGDFMDLHLSLDPRGSLAMKGSRHPVTLIGFDRIVSIMDGTVGKAIEDPTFPLELDYVGVRPIYGAPSDCYEVRIDKAARKDAYGREMFVCFDVESKLPIRVEVKDVEDGALRLVEAYGYEGVKLNVPLSDKDFDPDNPDYGF